MILFKQSKIVVILLLMLYQFADAQTVSFGTELGGGIIRSNSPSIGSFTSSIFIEGGFPYEEYMGYRLTLYYAGDFSSMLPGDRSVYYPFIKGASVKFIYSSNLAGSLYLEPGMGISALNDHVYSDRKSWGYGLAVSITGGKDFRTMEYSGFKLGLGTEYTLTFINFSASYFHIFLQVVYSI